MNVGDLVRVNFIPDTSSYHSCTYIAYEFSSLKSTSDDGPLFMCLTDDRDPDLWLRDDVMTNDLGLVVFADESPSQMVWVRMLKTNHIHYIYALDLERLA